ncbi:Calx-beta domain-containing protein [Okeania sp.]|uniref:Calx-beta domain-containing protein n=1 Tax=Okeania sp. TaxID=3100323 RepID=UPI002B4B2874|nr:Calx-beta domain-containing protein [Okeania sp.]MEB3343543.1 Calx-beta domain-containing protein [Okeania sp.]
MMNDTEFLDITPVLGLQQIHNMPDIAFLGEVSVESETTVEIIEKALAEVQNNLIDFATASTFEMDILTVFGESVDVDLAETIIDALAVGEELPQIIVASAEEMNGAAGGLDSMNGTVYLADSLINEGFLPVADVLVEEFGHLVDSELNTIDTPGDEGEWFAAKVRGDVLSEEDVARLQQEDDKIRIFGGLVEVEANTSKVFSLDDSKIFSGVLNESNQTDYYRFELRNVSDFSAYLYGLTGDANVYLYPDYNNNGVVDSDESYLTYSNNGGTSAESISARLPANNYLVRVSSTNLAEYQLRLVNETESAINVGNLRSEVIYSKDSLPIKGTPDKTDYYRFELKKASDFSAYLYELTGDVNVYLYPDYNDNGVIDSDEGYLTYGNNGGTTAESVTERLSAGKYLVKVSGDSSTSTEYQLRLVNESGSAVNVGNLQKDAIYKDVVGARKPTDKTDYYRFELKKTSYFSTYLYGLTGDANIYLYPDYNDNGVVDSDESYLTYSNNGGTSAESASARLSAGNYLVGVYSNSSVSTEYQLRLANESGSAVNVGNLQKDAIYKDIVGERNPADKIDYYRFDLKKASDFSASLYGLTGDANLYLYPDYNGNGVVDSDESYLTYSNNGGTSAESITTRLSAGKYLVSVYSSSPTSTEYQLRLVNESNGSGNESDIVEYPEKIPATVEFPEERLKPISVNDTSKGQNEATPKIAISNANITEGNKGRKNAKFTVTLDNESDNTVQVNYSTANDTAKAGKDYQKTNGTLTFKPGQTKKTIKVPILGDTIEESNEKFNLNLSKPKNATLLDKRGIGTIRNDDKTLPKISIGDAQITEGDNGKKQLKFDVTLSTTVNQRVEVNYATADDTAEKGSDYQKTKGKLVFKPNQRKKTITVPILGDTLQEEDETFTVNLSKPKNAKLGDRRAIGKIKDNEKGNPKNPDDGDTFDVPINLGQLVEREVITNNIGTTEGLYRDTDDYYRFKINREGTLRVFMDSLFEDANVELLGSKQELISQSENEGLAAEEIIQTLDRGVYYVRVYPSGGDRTPYRLSLTLI